MERPHPDYDTPRKHFHPMIGLVVMIGAAGSGKSTWASRLYPGLVPLSSDHMRLLLADDEDDQSASGAAFRVLEVLVRERLAHGKLTIVDATNTLTEARAQWLDLARELGVPVCAVWVDTPEEECVARQATRERKVPARVIARHHAALEGADVALVEEGFDVVLRVRDDAPVEVIKAWTPPEREAFGTAGALVRRAAFDVVGDVHGCHDELVELLERLGWSHDAQDGWSHPDDRLLVFVGDLTDRGPRNVDTLVLALDLIESGRALLVLGNHDDKLRRYMAGNKVNLDEHLKTTTDELDALDDGAREALYARATRALLAAPMWCAFAPSPERPTGALVVAHAAWKPSLIHAKKDKVRWFCLYGPSTGNTDELGYPERLDWRKRYPASAPTCVTGHTPYLGAPDPHAQTVCVDTACVFGGTLTALRWPSRELVVVEARETYSEKAGLGPEPRFAPDPKEL